MSITSAYHAATQRWRPHFGRRLKKNTPRIAMKNVNTVFGEQVIHKNLAFDLNAGEAVVLLGASGCGKTTLMRGMVGLEPAVTGTCMFAGKNLFDLSEDEWLPFRKRIAFAFQYGALFDGLSVYENCAFPLRELGNLSEEQISERVTNLLEILGIQDAKDKLPADISGGMQKRVGIARALAVEPEVLLLDEPTAGLDPSNCKKVVEIVRRLVGQGATVVIVSHDRESTLAMADRLVLLGEGKVVADIPTEQINAAAGQKIAQFLGDGGHQ